MLFSWKALLSQQAILRGNVINTLGEAIPGVVIVEKLRPTNGTTTSVDGSFQITLPAETNVILVFKGVGNQPYEQTFLLKAGETKIIDVVYDNNITTGGLEIIDKRNQENQIISISTKLPTKLQCSRSS